MNGAKLTEAVTSVKKKKARAINRSPLSLRELDGGRVSLKQLKREFRQRDPQFCIVRGRHHIYLRSRLEIQKYGRGRKYKKLCRLDPRALTRSAIVSRSALSLYLRLRFDGEFMLTLCGLDNAILGPSIVCGR